MHDKQLKLLCNLFRGVLDLMRTPCLFWIFVHRCFYFCLRFIVRRIPLPHFLWYSMPIILEMQTEWLILKWNRQTN